MVPGTALFGVALAQAADVNAAIETYADIAHAKYEDALNAAASFGPAEPGEFRFDNHLLRISA